MKHIGNSICPGFDIKMPVFRFPDRIDLGLFTSPLVVMVASSGSMGLGKS
jgi:hypothetical protein